MRTYPSPWLTTALIFGIILCAVAPPIGLIIIALGVCAQSSNTGRLRREYAVRVAKVERRYQSDRIAAGRYFSS